MGHAALRPGGALSHRSPYAVRALLRGQVCISGGLNLTVAAAEGGGGGKDVLVAQARGATGGVKGRVWPALGSGGLCVCQVGPGGFFGTTALYRDDLKVKATSTAAVDSEARDAAREPT